VVRRVVVFSTLTVAAAFAVTLHAQQPAVPGAKTGAVAAPASSLAGSPFGAIFGTVQDSMHDGVPLTDATVTVTQLPRKSTLTSEAGAFRIDSLPPGKYTLELLHSVLDSLGIRVVSDTITVVAGELQTKLLTIPSPATIAARVCPPLKQRLGPGAIVGQVLNADSETPAAGAEISAVWVETQVGSGFGVKTTPNVRKATVEADGTYRLCGLPVGFNGSIQASHGDAQTAEVPVDMAEQALVIRTLHLPPAMATDATATDSATVRMSSLRTGPARVTGRVVNKGGVPIPNALVSVQGGASATKAGNDGTFTLDSVPVGTQAVYIRHVGYIPRQITIDISTRGPNTVTAQLEDYHPPLPTVAVKAAAPSELKRVGFERRMKAGMGRYMTEDEIEKAAPTFTSDLLRRINGLHVIGSGHDLTVLSSRGETCVNYMIDRNSINADEGQAIDEMVNPRDIAAMEFYQANDVPLELTTGRNSGCALLVIWTRQQLKEPAPK
jgi:hypothetical protein